VNDSLPIPNHHHDFPAFTGATGLVAALSFLVGRDDDARFVSELINLRGNDRVVDIGCGPGVAARYAAAAGAEVVGVDPAAVMLRVAKRRKSRVSWKRGTAESIPVEDGWASVVWSLSTVHHWADVEAGLAEVRRVLGPNGRFVVTERQIEAGATGHDSHGWTPAQSNSFAACCEAASFVDVTAGRQVRERGAMLYVSARSTQ
jgi:ubiquinone/menaquinone biosynthesis C-methylase UbiE